MQDMVYVSITSIGYLYLLFVDQVTHLPFVIVGHPFRPCPRHRRLLLPSLPYYQGPFPLRPFPPLYFHIVINYLLHSPIPFNVHICHLKKAYQNGIEVAILVYLVYFKEITFIQALRIVLLCEGCSSVSYLDGVGHWMVLSFSFCYINSWFNRLMVGPYLCQIQAIASLKLYLWGTFCSFS